MWVSFCYSFAIYSFLRGERICRFEFFLAAQVQCQKSDGNKWGPFFRASRTFAVLSGRVWEGCEPASSGQLRSYAQNAGAAPLVRPHEDVTRTPAASAGNCRFTLDGSLFVVGMVVPQGPSGKCLCVFCLLFYFRERKTHKHKQICGIVPGLGGCQKFVYVFFFFFSGRSLMGGKHINKVPSKIPGQSREKFVYVFFFCMCFFRSLLFLRPQRNKPNQH